MANDNEGPKARRRAHGQGHIYKRGRRCSIPDQGRRVRESAGATATDARRVLKARLHEIAAGTYIGPELERATVGDLLDALEIHLEAKGAKAMTSLRSHLEPVRSRFGDLRVVSLTAEKIERFARDQLAAGKARATVNREVGALKQALNLAQKQGRVREVPYVPKLREENARQGFFEADDFYRVLRHLPDPSMGSHSSPTSPDGERARSCRSAGITSIGRVRRSAWRRRKTGAVGYCRSQENSAS